MLAALSCDQLVMEYLAALRAAVTGLPRADELVERVGAQITAVRLQRPDDGPAEVQAFLDGLGNPYVIAAAAFGATRPLPAPPVLAAPVAAPPVVPRPVARRPAPPPASDSKALEVSAVVALTAGAVLTPAVGPFAGVVMASCSPRWHPVEKAWAWLLVTSPITFALLCLPLVLFLGSDALAALVVLGAAGAAVVGPMAAGIMLATRLSRPAPRHARW